jgi:putative addiction module component (TIGR02574 family)
LEIVFMAKPKLDYRSLSVPERLDLVGDIWDSIAQDAESLELTPEERAELDRRLAEHERDPSSAIPWETVKDELFRRGG